MTSEPYAIACVLMVGAIATQSAFLAVLFVGHTTWMRIDLLEKRYMLRSVHIDLGRDPLNSVKGDKE